jgi:hypothetical protein
MRKTNMLKELKEYTSPVTFGLLGIELNWTPEGLSSEPGFAREIQRSLEQYLDTVSYGQEEVAATPEGPFLPTTTKSLYTVVWLLYALYGDEKLNISGTAPTLRDMGLDLSSNYDENGNPIVR